MVSFLSQIQSFFVSLDNMFSEAGTINCRVPQRSISGPLLFLLDINYIPQAPSDSQIYSYANDTSIFYQHKDVTETENILSKNL